MIATGIFLFLLGTKVGRTSAVQSDVKYEPSRITIREQIDQGPNLIPELGPPPYLPNFVHQGSNYFFGMPFPMPQGSLPPALPVEKIVTEIREEKKCRGVCKPEIAEILIEKENPPFTNPVIEVSANDVIHNPRLSLPIPNIGLNVQPIPHLPTIYVPIVNSALISQLPLPSLNIPGLPILKSSKASRVPMLIERPIQSSGGAIISEVDVLVKRIPPPPELPPLVLEEILKPVIVEDKKVVLIPSPPEIQLLLPPSMFVDEICPPTLCAQNIVFERVLPNIACEKSKTVELISIPASKRVPVVTTPLFSLKKK